MTTVTARDVSQLLFPESDRVEDLNEWSMVTKASQLHIRRDGHEVLSQFSLEGAPLQLFRPRFWLSPDEKSLITLAPVREVPPRWERYKSATSEQRPFATTERRQYPVAYENP